MAADGWTAKRIELKNIVDAMRADIASGVGYMYEHPISHKPLTDRATKAVERNMHKILDGLEARLPPGFRQM